MWATGCRHLELVFTGHGFYWAVFLQDKDGGFRGQGPVLILSSRGHGIVSGTRLMCSFTATGREFIWEGICLPRDCYFRTDDYLLSRVCFVTGNDLFEGSKLWLLSPSLLPGHILSWVWGVTISIFFTKKLLSAKNTPGLPTWVGKPQPGTSCSKDQGSTDLANPRPGRAHHHQGVLQMGWGSAGSHVFVCNAQGKDKFDFF